MRRAALALLLAGCKFVAEDGERRATGECPADEVCSDETPLGLRFVGGKFADEWEADAVHALALGGTQTVWVIIGPQFDAVSGGNGLAVEGVTYPNVTIRGIDDGDEYLRIVKPGTDELYDRVLVRSGAIDVVSLRPRPLLPLRGTRDDDMQSDDPTRGVAMVVGTEASLVIQLHDAAGERLYDDSLVASSLDPDLASFTSSEWDGAWVEALAPGTATIRMIGGDGFSRDVPLRIVAEDAIDDVECAGTLFSQTAVCVGEVQLGSSTLCCFRATSGAEVVLGATLTFAGSSALALRPHAEPLASCVSINAVQLGAATMVVTAGNRSRTFGFQVVPAS